MRVFVIDERTIRLTSTLGAEKVILSMIQRSDLKIGKCALWPGDDPMESQVDIVFEPKE